MRVNATIIRNTGETEYPGIMRFAVLNTPAFGPPAIVAMFTNLAGAREWQEKMYSFNAEVVALVRDAGDGVRGHKVQRDDNLDMMKK